MNKYLKLTFITGIFVLIGCGGVALSISAPYLPSDDEEVYLTGALQARDGNLPDAYMLQGMDFGPYVYPKILLDWYGVLGHDVFKSIYLMLLAVSTGLAAYWMFRVLKLPEIPAVVLSVIALMPRFSSGMEIFGMLTFKEAIGRAEATPLFFIGTALLISRLIEKKSLWPIFGLFGLLLFLHPVTVMLFAFVSLVAVGVCRLILDKSFIVAVREMLVSGVVFVLAGMYFFADVFARLVHGVDAAGVSNTLYVQAITFRNAWEFAPGSFQWFPHMGIVSAFFVVVIVAFYLLPQSRSLRMRYMHPWGNAVLWWGMTVAATSLVGCLLIPGLNLYFMEHANAPYIFQQWSRMSKFYYLGLFIALVPVVYTLWQRIRLLPKIRRGVFVGMFVCAGVCSSSFAFEVAQFVVGYPNYTAAYIPQSLSGIPDGVSPAEYKEVCAVLDTWEVGPEDLVVSNNLAFRYYCRARLYVTQEEGGAYQQLYRSDMVAWYERIQLQREALREGNLDSIISFAGGIGARYLILPKTEKYTKLAESRDVEVVQTVRYMVVRIKQ